MCFYNLHCKNPVSLVTKKEKAKKETMEKYSLHNIKKKEP